MKLNPVILAGGAGTRLWPMSRESFPKQFLSLLDGKSPFQATLSRCASLGRIEAPIVVVNGEHRFLAADQARAAQRALKRIYIEPVGRSTAPAIALVAYDLVAEDPEALMLVLPADHDIPDEGPFADAVETAQTAAAQGHLMVFGIEPRWPETGYGYIERGSDVITAPGCHQVASFVEKPELEIATRLAESGRHYWNSGMFLFSAARYLEELERLEPEMAQACREAARASSDDGDCRRIDRASFERCRSMSIDHAVMERTHSAAVVPARFRWSDIGSWDALWDRAQKDGDGNDLHGDTQLHDVTNCYVHSAKRLVVGIGLEDTVIIDTPDALLVARRGETQRVREAVEQLKAEGRGEHKTHRLMHRPWGHYEDIDAGERFRVKRITVAPGGKLSLQYHHHRAEHWIIVSGTARVTKGDTVTMLSENQSIYISVGETHRLENPGKIPLQLIEVQTGAYLGEDDIVRVEDVYQRVGEAAK
ncbi:MAG TPA: mannose-1-phosphate guanylyltransferase/mannose-6-phosphate isomerase [Usitatibacter sp.]|nr:mannose-1-phosphate guanylyltransferase/mannose-6-phosphate isomerase [Usitatibacter sp.]